ncbi:MAG: ribose-phosphate pyrophosphokinase [Candidatus Marinimicrobia bacterium]|nr:ribose-phosphate pyrophosphokinase [Candidatus Neomarinimicrobiota bacterium]
MKIFSGTSNIKIAEKIANLAGVPLGKIDLETFSDGELRVAFQENIRGENVFLVQSTNPPAENLMQLLLMLDAAKRASAKTVTAVIPYYGYSRQDRKDQPRVPISARMIMDLMSAAGVDRMITMDLHSPQIQGFTNVPFDNLYSRIVLFNKLKEYQLDFDNGVVLAPDVGSAKMSQSYAKKLGIGFALIDKRRPKHNVTEVVNLIGDLKDKHVFIIDDMIDTAGTICNAARTAIENGAKSVMAIATHPVLSGPAIERLKDAPIDKIIVSDTIDISNNKIFNKLEIVSVAEVFAEAIIRINKGDSISELFK